MVGKGRMHYPHSQSCVKEVKSQSKLWEKSNPRFDLPPRFKRKIQHPGNERNMRLAFPQLLQKANYGGRKKADKGKMALTHTSQFCITILKAD